MYENLAQILRGVFVLGECVESGVERCSMWNNWDVPCGTMALPKYCGDS